MARTKKQKKQDPPEKSNTKAEKRVDGKVMVKKKKSRNLSYKSYIFKVLKQIHGDIGISGKAMTIMNDMINDIFERIANEASLLAKKETAKTLMTRDVRAAVLLLIPGELGRHAVSEGDKSIIKYNASVAKDQK